MKKLLLSVEKDYCSECSLALTRFIGNMDGIDSLGIENGSIAIVFDESKIQQQRWSKSQRKTFADSAIVC